MSATANPARATGYHAFVVAQGLGVFALLMAGWTLMAVAVSPLAHWQKPTQHVAQVPPVNQSSVCACGPPHIAAAVRGHHRTVRREARTYQ